MDDLFGQKPICVVRQKPFEARSESGLSNEFCNLLPLLNEDGSAAFAGQYPDDGTIWWMLRPGTRGYAEPTRLVTGLLEHTAYFGSPGKAHYQLQVDSVVPVRSQQYLEIIDVAPEAIGEPRDLVSSRSQVVIDHVPLNEAYVRWRGQLIGPFRVTAQPHPANEGEWYASFTPANTTDQSVLQLSSDLLAGLPRSRIHEMTVIVSLDDRPPSESWHQHTCRYSLVDADAIRGSIPAGASRFVLLSDTQIVQRLTRRFLNRTKRQSLTQLLGDLHDVISRSPAEALEQERSLVSDLVQSNELEIKEVDKLAASLVAAGFVKPAIQDAIERHARQHVQQNAARLQAEISQQVSDLQNQRDQLQRTCEELETSFQARRRQTQRELETELSTQREGFDKECRERERNIERQRQDLERQGRLLSHNLETVAERFANNRDDVINQFLAIAPLLEQRGLLAHRPTLEVLESERPESVRTAAGQSNTTFMFPEFVTTLRDTDLDAVSEIDFFERFEQHVENSGFSYRREDLASFHLSVKCGDLTILGGLSGTGKSSLPRLYADALAGDSTDVNENRYLHVAVSPSWLDMRDLLGHFNAIEQTFQPSESGLFQHLIYAHEEFANRGSQTGMYIVCLDEMNLAHVEHYFHGVLQVLEQPDAIRELRCFARNVVSSNSQFARWATVALPRSLRFIGTVNFDETTRQLSQRLLDRANLIRLPSDTLPRELGEPKAARAQGSPISLHAFRSWVNPSAAITPQFGDLIDRLREPLQTLGCPMNPRRLRAMRQFISSCPAELGGADLAVDMQIAQRLLPQVRGLFRPGARAAVDAIQVILEKDSIKFGESLRVLREIGESEDLAAYDERIEPT